MNEASRAMDSVGRSRSGELLAASAFLAGWLLLPFWNIVTLQKINVQDDIYTSDLLNDRLPARAFVGKSLRNGALPFWMPGVYTGFPTLAAVEVGTLYPSNLILFGCLPPYVAIAYAQVLPLFLAGLGTFLLARDHELPMASSLLSAGAFSLSGFFVCHLRQLNMVDAACWVPLELALVERTIRHRPGRAPAALAVVWAVQLLAGHPQVSYFTGLVLVAYLVARWRQIDRSHAAVGGFSWPARFARDRAVWKLGAAIVVGTLAAAVQLLPGIELAMMSHRQGGFTFEQASMYPAPLESIWTFVAPYRYGDPGFDSYRLSGIFWEQYGYLGLLTALLAVVAVVFGWREPIVRLLGAMTIFSFLMVLGRNAPFFFWTHRIIPGMSYFRFPTRFLLFVELGIALLGGFGLRFVVERIRGSRGRLAVGAAVLLLTLGDLWIHQMRQIPRASWKDWTSPIATERFLSAERESSPEPWRYYSLDSTAVHTATFHAARGWGSDLGPFVRLRAMLQPSFNLLFDLESPDGYVNLAPRPYEALWGSEKVSGFVRPSGTQLGDQWLLKPEVAKLLRLFNVRYVISAPPVISPDLVLAAETAEGARIYRLKEPLPRAFVVGSVVRAESEEKAIELLRSPSFDPQEKALIHDEPVVLPPDAAPSRDVVVTGRSNTTISLRAILARPGLLVLSEGYYPGWKAKVDGVDAPIIRANLMMRAVALPAGEHDVKFEFHSRTITAGWIVSLFGIMLIWVGRSRLQ